jgi:hypothetical protein
LFRGGGHRGEEAVGVAALELPGAFRSWDDQWHTGKVLGIAGNEPLKTLSKCLDEHVGDWSLARVTGALLGYVVGPKAMGIPSV